MELEDILERAKSWAMEVGASALAMQKHLGSMKISYKTAFTRHAKRAAHLAPDLRGNAHGIAVLIFH